MQACKPHISLCCQVNIFVRADMRCLNQQANLYQVYLETISYTGDGRLSKDLIQFRSQQSYHRCIL